jgi:tetraacyldisaccharide 4'-kinase
VIVLLGSGHAESAEPAGIRQADRPIFRARLEPVRGEHLAGVSVVAFAGIGRPEKFVASLRAVGATLVAAHPFADHHPFTEAEINGLRREAERVGARLVTTAKDWVRLTPSMRDRVLVLEVEIDWRDRASLAQLLSAVLRRTPHERGPHGHDNEAGHGYGRSAARG